jgi:hypothetical protein
VGSRRRAAHRRPWAPTAASRRARNHRRLGHERMLDQRTLHLERADAIVGALEDVVGAAT